MYTFTDVNFNYKNLQVFQNFSLDIPEDKISFILGHNGAGKTTLLKLLIGSLIPKSGQIRNNVLSKDTFFLVGSNNLYSDLSIRENLKFHCLLKGFKITKSEIQNNISVLSQKLQIQRYMDMKVNELSSGLKKRTALLCGLIFNPSAIFLDEPTNDIDPETKIILTSLIKELKSRGKSIVVVTHDLDFCHEVSEHNIIINNGKVVKIEKLSLSKKAIGDFKLEYLEYTKENGQNESNNLQRLN